VCRYTVVMMWTFSYDVDFAILLYLEQLLVNYILLIIIIVYLVCEQAFSKETRKVMRIAIVNINAYQYF